MKYVFLRTCLPDKAFTGACPGNSLLDRREKCFCFKKMCVGIYSCGYHKVILHSKICSCAHWPINTLCRKSGHVKLRGGLLIDRSDSQ